MVTHGEANAGIGTPELYVDLEREKLPETGIYVRAIRVKGDERRYDDVDIAHLDKLSLFKWLRSRGGDNFWAECVVALILGHRDFDAAELTDVTVDKQD